MKLPVALLVLAFSGLAIAQGSSGVSHPFGAPAQPSEATRIVPVKATDDMRFVFPRSFTIQQGDVIRFIVVNAGRIEHGFSIGDGASQHARAATMKKRPDMEHADDPSAVTLKPGEIKEITWRFDKPVEGDVVLACHLPGHYEAGMVSRVPFVKR